MRLPLLSAAIAALGGVAVSQDLPADILLDTLAGPFSSASNSSRAIAVVDLNGDTSLDLVIANQDENNAVFFNDGNGAFTAQAAGVVGSIVTDGGNSRGVATADVDGDGDNDVFFANSLGQANFLYINQGGTQGGTTGNFVRVNTGDIATTMLNSRNACFADLDGDTDLDLFVANFNNQPNSLYLNDGSGGFTLAVGTPFVVDGGVSFDCDVGDIDNDGDLDIFVSNHDGLPAPSPGSANFLYINQGGTQGGTEGAFVRSLAGPVALDIGNSLCASFADFNGDGNLDLFVANDESQDNDLYTGDGAGGFSAVVASPVISDRGESIACEWVDVDVDGDVDLIVGNRANSSNRLYLNVDGEFRSQAFGDVIGTPSDTYGIASGDVDGNGFPDIFMANFGGGGGEANFHYGNNGPQWVDLEFPLDGVAGDPTLGATGNLITAQFVSLDIANAAPNATTAMIVGATSVFVPLKGGILVPTPNVILDGFSTNALGELQLGGPMPAGIQGDVELFFQAWIVDPAGFKGFASTNGVSVVTPGL